MSKEASETSKEVVLKIVLSRDEYEALKAIARREGFNLVSDYLKTVIKDIVDGRIGRTTTGLESADLIAKRLERVVADLINPFTGKIDEILRRLADISELLEKSEVEKAKPVAREAVREAKRTPTTAMEKLREQGVVFQEDVQWMKSPDKFFEKLKKEGAIVLDVGGEKIAVDPDFWTRFEEELGKISVSNIDEVVSLLEASLGEPSGKLLRKMAKAGLIVYDEDEGTWVIRLKKQT